MLNCICFLHPPSFLTIQYYRIVQSQIISLTWIGHSHSAMREDVPNEIKLDDLSRTTTPPPEDVGEHHRAQDETPQIQDTVVILPSQLSGNRTNENAKPWYKSFQFYHIVDATSADIRDLLGMLPAHLLSTNTPHPPILSSLRTTPASNPTQHSNAPGSPTHAPPTSSPATPSSLRNSGLYMKGNAR